MIDNDNAHFLYNPSTYTLSGLNAVTATTFNGALNGNAGSATQLATSRNIGGVSFNGTADINLPGVNTSGNQDTSGTATQADNINVDEENSNLSYQIIFSSQNDSGYNRMRIDTDNSQLVYNPSTNLLSGLNISASQINGTFGDINDNAYGARTVGTGNPTGGNNGDIHYKI
mgnify:FL=1